jgi:hypothetical protein
VLPRSITSPNVAPSLGTGASVVGSATINPSRVGYATPWRAAWAARSGSGSPSHSGCQAHIVAGPYDSVRPYRCVTRNPMVSIAPMTADGGAAPPVATSTT